MPPFVGCVDKREWRAGGVGLREFATYRIEPAPPPYPVESPRLEAISRCRAIWLAKAANLRIAVVLAMASTRSNKAGSPVVASVDTATNRTSGCGSRASHSSHCAASTLDNRGTARGAAADFHVGTEKLPGKFQIDFAEIPPRNSRRASADWSPSSAQPPHQIEHVDGLQCLARGVLPRRFLGGDRQSPPRGRGPARGSAAWAAGSTQSADCACWIGPAVASRSFAFGPGGSPITWMCIANWFEPLPDRKT